MVWIEPGTLLGLIIYPSKFVGKESTSNWTVSQMYSKAFRKNVFTRVKLIEA
jgi:hypothetical protein